MPPIELVVRDVLVFEHRQYIELAGQVGAVAPAHARQRRGGGCRCPEGWGATLVQEDLPTAFFKIGSS